MKETSLPFKIRIASPCPARWEDMGGDDRTRFCDQCKKNVHNISAMPAAEAAALLQGADGNMCVRIFQRADGTVLTEDCPVGIARQWRRAKTFAAATLGTILFAMVSLTALGRGNASPTSRNDFRDRVVAKLDDATWTVKGWFGIERPSSGMLMGKIAMPTTAPPQRALMGEVTMPVAVVPPPTTPPPSENK